MPSVNYPVFFFRVSNLFEYVKWEVFAKYRFATYHFAKYRFAKYHFAKYHFAKYRFTKYRFAKYHFVSFRFVSQSTISRKTTVGDFIWMFIDSPMQPCLCSTFSRYIVSCMLCFEGTGNSLNACKVFYELLCSGVFYIVLVLVF